MASAYKRAQSPFWYAKWRGADGKIKAGATTYRVDDPQGESNARRFADAMEKKAARQASGAAPAGPLTVAQYAERWAKKRTHTDGENEASRLRLHVLPVLGSMRLDAVRVTHVADWMTALRASEKLAPRTIRATYRSLRLMFKSAIRGQIVTDNPCVLEREELPTAVDKDPEWRPTARFTRAELERLISDPRIPPDRHVFYGLEGVGALRTGEACGLRWRHVIDREPLGCILIACSYDEGVKTERPREMPAHPVLAALLASWRATGWAAMFGRVPGPDDLVVPLEPAPPPKTGGRRNPRALPDGSGMRTKNDAWKRVRRDLLTLGFRHRRAHDLRRTMISLAREDGARGDILELCTHTPGARGTIDIYTSIDWTTRCAEVAKLRLSLPAPDGAGYTEVTVPKSTVGEQSLWTRSG